MAASTRRVLALALILALGCLLLGAAPARLREAPPMEAAPEGMPMEEPPMEGEEETYIPVEQGPVVTDPPAAEVYTEPGPAEVPAPVEAPPMPETAYDVPYVDPLEHAEKTAAQAVVLDRGLVCGPGGCDH